MFENEPRSIVEDLPAPTQPVVVTPVRSSRRFGVRWMVALIVVALVATASIAGARLLTNQTLSIGAHLSGWAPAGSVVYVEARLDLPGDQHDKLGAFLAHFPGFGAAANVDTRLTEIYDRIIRDATNTQHDYTSEIKPWFTGSLGVAVTTLPPVGDPDSKSPGALLMAGVKDQTAARAWLDKVVAEGTPNPTTSTYANVDLVTAGHGSYAVLSDVLLVGDTPSVKSALDLNGKGGLALVAGFAKATGAIDASSLMTYYVDGAQYLEWVLATASQSGASLSACQATNTFPSWFAGSVRADTTALVSRNALPHSVTTGLNAKSALLAHLPASTLVVLDQHDVGAAVKRGVEQFKKCAPEGSTSVMDQIDTAVESMGGWDSLTGWIGETALVLDQDGREPTGGVLIVPKDRAAADRLALQATNAAGQAGPGVTVSEETYAGATLTVVRGTTPSGAMRTMTLAFVVTDQVVAVGLESWVKKVLDTLPGNSLATDARFTSALARVSAEHTTLVYANVAGLYDWVEGTLGPDALAEYEGEVGPYLEPLDTFIMTSAVGNDVDHTDLAISVK